jgi:hypothetical protein
LSLSQFHPLIIHDLSPGFITGVKRCVPLV